ncbi:MAG: hypothetical protein BWX64_01828 [Acidobacteria bacterium ADurb.Bin051]|jgi:DNA-binding HxlR family transcriptional regulator|nr:MAG: hypothetical protein BWX64_01828 [Acidobacteria bacterium ADurb.Bin051]
MGQFDQGSMTTGTLQRDLKTMMEKGLIVPEGATNQLIYRLPGRK